jgi:hypothetical protein
MNQKIHPKDGQVYTKAKCRNPVYTYGNAILKEKVLKGI